MTVLACHCKRPEALIVPVHLQVYDVLQLPYECPTLCG